MSEPLTPRQMIAAFGGPADAAAAMNVGLRKMERVYSGRSRCPPSLLDDMRATLARREAARG